MLDITGLFKSFGKSTALDGLDLSIAEGELFGFVGPNGAGKTTTMRIISGLLNADRGDIFLNGKNVKKHTSQVKSMIGYMPDYFGVYDNLKVSEYMEFYASIYGKWDRKSKLHCEELLDKVHLLDKKDVFVDGLSRGMKQRLCLARCLIHDPKLLVLDEPASGMDPRSRFEMKEILGYLHEQGKTIIISSHILPELSGLCTTLGIIERGKMVVKGTVEEILKLMNQACPLQVVVLDGLQEAIQVCKKNELVDNIIIKDQELLLTFTGKSEDEAELLGELVQASAKVISFRRQEGNLESVFLKVTAVEE